MLNFFADDRNRNETAISMHRIAGTCIIGATPVAGTVWALRNNHATQDLVISLFELTAGFMGAAGPTAQSIEVIRFNTATPTSGTALNPIPCDSRVASISASIDTRISAGTTLLTTTNVVFEAGPLFTTVRGRSLVNMNQKVNIDGGLIILHPGEGLALRTGATAVAGEIYSVNVACYLENRA